MTDTSNEAVERLIAGSTDEPWEQDAVVMLAALRDERNQLRIRHSDYMNDYVQMGMARDAAEAERDASERGLSIVTQYARMLENDRSKLRAGIQAYLSGDYPNPRDHRPGKCQHGASYWEECTNCSIEHFTKVLEESDND